MISVLSVPFKAVIDALGLSEFLDASLCLPNSRSEDTDNIEFSPALTILVD
jgi:hypothetical protein